MGVLFSGISITPYPSASEHEGSNEHEPQVAFLWLLVDDADKRIANLGTAALPPNSGGALRLRAAWG